MYDKWREQVKSDETYKFLENRNNHLHATNDCIFECM